VGNVVGGFVNPISGGAKVAQLLGKAPSVVRALLSGSAAGATGGAVAGFGEGEGGVASRLGNAGTGGTMGAVGGAALGAGANVAAGVGGRVLHALGLRSPEVAADRHLARALLRDKTDPTTVAGALAANPPGTPATVMDAAGRNTVQLGATVANTPSDAMQAADQFVQARRGGRPERIAGAVDDAFGGGGGTRVADDVAALTARRTADSRPAYEALYASEAPDSPAMRGLMDDKTVKAAAARGLETQRIEDVARRDHSAPDTAPFEPNRMRQIDGAKRGLDAMIGATLDPTSRKIIPGQGDRNYALTELRAALLREADANPLYPQARAAWAGPTQSMEALGNGQRALAMNRDDLARAFERMGDSDREFFRIGVGRAVTDATSDPARAAGAARKMLEDRQMQARLETVIPDPVQRAEFSALLEREVAMGQVEHTVSPRANSHTNRLAASGEDLAHDPVGGTVASLLTSGPVNATRQALGHMYRLGQGINNATADAMAKRLFETDPDKARAILQQIDLRGQTDQKNALLRQALMGRLLQGAGVAAAPSEP
jgi:hypothetical protein